MVGEKAVLMAENSVSVMAEKWEADSVFYWAACLDSETADLSAASMDGKWVAPKVALSVDD